MGFTGHKCARCKQPCSHPCFTCQTWVHPRNFHKPHLNICIRHHGTGQRANANLWCFSYAMFLSQKKKWKKLNEWKFLLCYIWLRGHRFFLCPPPGVTAMWFKANRGKTKAKKTKTKQKRTDTGGQRSTLTYCFKISGHLIRQGAKSSQLWRAALWESGTLQERSYGLLLYWAVCISLCCSYNGSQTKQKVSNQKCIKDHIKCNCDLCVWDGVCVWGGG